MTSVSTVQSEYPGCKILLVNVDISKMPHITGNVYAVSRNRDSIEALYALDEKLACDGKATLIVGSYNREGVVGVQYFKK